MRAKLLAGTYTPSPVRRVLIPKPNGGTRMLGIPTVLDRFVQQLLLQVLEPIWEPLFSAHSYGFRPGRSAHDAVGAAREQVRQGKSWVVDVDITSFFDRVHHDILMSRIGRVVRDKRLLRLIGKYLRSGELVEGVMVASEEGTPQGGPLSPLLANIYLDALDKELEGRGLAFVRYADDCNIYVSSPRAAERVLASVSQWLARELRLEVNATKSGVGRPWERKFLGFRIRSDLQIKVAPASVERFKERVRGLWRTCQILSSVQRGTTGARSCEAGGATIGWLRSAATSCAGKAGFGGTCGNAFGNGGTTGGVGGASCDGWACGVVSCVWRRVVAAPGAWRPVPRCSRH